MARRPPPSCSGSDSHPLAIAHAAPAVRSPSHTLQRSGRVAEAPRHEETSKAASESQQEKQKSTIARSAPPVSHRHFRRGSRPHRASFAVLQHQRGKLELLLQALFVSPESTQKQFPTEIVSLFIYIYIYIIRFHRPE